MLPPHPSCRLDEAELEEEEEHFQQVLRAFASHAAHCERILSKYRRDYEALAAEHRTRLDETGYVDKIGRARQCTGENQEFYDFVTAPHRNSHHPRPTASHADGQLSVSLPSAALTQTEAENLRSLLRQVMRDWSAEGSAERQAAYGPLVHQLRAHFPEEGRGERQVLVPGAGLGRLAYDINQAGFSCQGNEFSLFMLLVSETFLTRSLTPAARNIYPFVLPFSNTRRAADQFRPVSVPDIVVQGAPAGTTFSMVAGDFLEVYRDEGAASWDAIVTCYFIDTAKNILDYLELMYRLLVPGGVWINHGPLLYHFEGHHREPSIELSAEEIKRLAQALGFVFVTESWSDSTYAQNSQSLYQTIYQCWSFTAIKKGD